MAAYQTTSYNFEVSKPILAFQMKNIHSDTSPLLQSDSPRPPSSAKPFLKYTLFFFGAILLIALTVYWYISGGDKQPPNWDSLDAILEQSVAVGAFPGCVALVAKRNRVYYSKGIGNYTYGTPPPFHPPGFSPSLSPPMTNTTRFDMASCSKVFATTSAVALLYQDGLLNLNDEISAAHLLGSKFAANGKANITVLNCMLHNAGFPPDPNPNYWNTAFGCEQTSKPFPQEVFDCRSRIYDALLQQSLQYPIGSKYVYSDLSMITMMFVVGRVVQDNAAFYGLSQADLLPACVQGNESDTQCWYEAFVRKNVLSPLKMHSSGFLQNNSDWGLCAPAENDTSYQHITIQGQVSDGNAYAMGGIAGHAGLFSNIEDLNLFMQDLMFARSLLNATTVSFFTTEYNHSQSSRAIGWNTNDQSVPDQGWSNSCGKLSAKTFMHLGYTGTMICGDPEREAFVVLLTNRVYPTDTNLKIHEARQNFTNAAAELLDHL